MGASYSRQTVNLPEDLVPVARERWERMGFRSFTDYVETLIRSDLAERPILLRDEKGTCFTQVIREARPYDKEMFNTTLILNRDESRKDEKVDWEFLMVPTHVAELYKRQQASGFPSEESGSSSEKNKSG